MFAAAVVLLAGCAAQRVEQALVPAVQRVASSSSGGDLLYVTAGGPHKGFFYLLSYPSLKTFKKVVGYQELPETLCSGTGGEVFGTEPLTLAYGLVVEYAHAGTTPIASWSESVIPQYCSVDPTTGNVAVTNDYEVRAERHGFIAVFTPGSSTPKRYRESDIGYFAGCAYDGSGDLYALAYKTHDRGGLLVELPAGGSTLRHITLIAPLNRAAALEWDGKDLVAGWGGVFDNEVFRIGVSGSTTTLLGTLTLKREHFESPDQFWIAGNQIVGTFEHTKLHPGALIFWPYPSGDPKKSYIHTLGGTDGVFGVTLSPGSTR